MYSIEEFDKFKTKMLKYIMYKKRTEQEIRRKFSTTIEDQNLLDDLIEHLKEIGYINDNSYIERAVSEHVNINNLSLKELRYKLLSKGLDGNLVDDYMYNNKEKLEEYEINSARNIILKKQATLEEQEITQNLLKKGYKIDNIREAIDRITDK